MFLHFEGVSSQCKEYLFFEFQGKIAKLNTLKFLHDQSVSDILYSYNLNDCLPCNDNVLIGSVRTLVDHIDD